MKRKKCSIIILAAMISVSSISPVTSVYAENNQLRELVEANLVERVLVEDNFESYETEESFDDVWEYRGSNKDSWSVTEESENSENKVLKRVSGELDKLIRKDFSDEDYKVSAKVKEVASTGDGGHLSLCARYSVNESGQETFYSIQMIPNKVWWANGPTKVSFALLKTVNGKETTLKDLTRNQVDSTDGKFHDLSIEVKGEKVIFTVDGIVNEFIDTSISEGGVALIGKNSGDTNRCTIEVDDLSITTTSPVAPNGIKGEIQSSSAKLSWDKVEGASSYSVYRANSEDGEYIAIAQGVEEATYTDSGLKENTNYYYKVQAIGEGGASKLSDSYVVNVGESNNKGLVMLKEKSANTVSLTWNTVNNAKSYKVYRRVKDSDSYKVIYEGKSNNIVDLGLISDKEYYYCMSYMDDNGVESFKSSELNVKTDLEQSRIPTGLELRSHTNVEAVIAWETVLEATSYSVYRAESEDGEYEKIADIEERSYVDSTIEPGKNYYYKVTSKNAIGESEKSKYISVEAVNDVVTNGVSWYTDENEIMQSHAGGVIKVGDTYYMYGEDRGDNNYDFKSVQMYKSKDLKNWEHANTILDKQSPVKDDDDVLRSDLENSNIERPKIIYNEKTGKYVMWFHYEEAGSYGFGGVGVAISDTVDGEYTFLGRFRPMQGDPEINDGNGVSSRDMTAFVDDDGSAYLICSSENKEGTVNCDLALYKLNDDYTAIEERLPNIYTMNDGSGRWWQIEAPAITKRDGIYYVFTSACSGWYPNQGSYLTATSLTEGDWSERKLIANNSTFDGQSNYAFTIDGTEESSVILASTRWKSDELSKSQYIWLPVEFDNSELDEKTGAPKATLEYYSKLDIDVETGVVTPDKSSQLLSEGKVATASVTAPGYNPSAVNDGDYSTEWKANTSGDWPAWWKVDLGAKYNLSNAQISWFIHNGSEAVYQYKIWVSDDDVNYTLAIDKTDNKWYGFSDAQLNGIQGRYVKIELVNAKLHNNPNNWYTPQLYEVKVYGNEIEASDTKSILGITINNEQLQSFDEDRNSYVVGVNDDNTPEVGAVLENYATGIISQALDKSGVASIDILTQALDEYKYEVNFVATKEEFIVEINKALKLGDLGGLDISAFRLLGIEGLTGDNLDEIREGLLSQYSDKDLTGEEIVNVIEDIINPSGGDDNGGDNSGGDNNGGSDDNNNDNDQVTNEKPVIAAKDIELKVGDNFEPLSGVTASDKEDGDLTSKINVVENTVNTSKAGVYKVTYKVIDSDNNETILTINVKVTSKATINTGTQQKPNLSGGKLPQTGGVNSMFAILIGGMAAFIGGLTFKKRKNNDL